MASELPLWQVNQSCSFWAGIQYGRYKGICTLVLDPLLFSVFIDDLINICENNLYLYADDSTLFAPIRSVEGRDLVAAVMNRNLERIKAWADN